MFEGMILRLQQIFHIPILADRDEKDAAGMGGKVNQGIYCPLTQRGAAVREDEQHEVGVHVQVLRGLRKPGKKYTLLKIRTIQRETDRKETESEGERRKLSLFTWLSNYPLKDS